MAKDLTEKQEIFIKGVVDGMTPSVAARNAGYAFPDQDANRLKNLPHIQKELFSRQMSALTTEILPKSLRRIDEILDDTSAAPAGIKLKAAQYVIDKTIDLQNMASAADIANKNPLEMSAMELELFIVKGRAVMSRERALRDMGIIEAE